FGYEMVKNLNSFILELIENIISILIVLLIVKNDTDYRTPLAFGLSNKENNWTIILVVLLFKNNIPWTDPMCEHLWHYKDLPNKKEFQRIRNLEGIVHGTILCWFYIMQAFEENLKTLNIPDHCHTE
ncbi:24434_t:CDS:2, partial [Gigaspora rosea]